MINPKPLAVLIAAITFISFVSATEIHYEAKFVNAVFPNMWYINENNDTYPIYLDVDVPGGDCGDCTFCHREMNNLTDDINQALNGSTLYINEKDNTIRAIYVRTQHGYSLSHDNIIDTLRKEIHITEEIMIQQNKCMSED